MKTVGFPVNIPKINGMHIICRYVLGIFTDPFSIVVRAFISNSIQCLPRSLSRNKQTDGTRCTFDGFLLVSHLRVQMISNSLEPKVGPKLGGLGDKVAFRFGLGGQDSPVC